jgi:hypothetical protein
LLGAVAADHPSPHTVVCFQDDFAYAAGAKQTQLNGQEPVSDGEIHCLMYTYGRRHRLGTGDLEMIMTEEETVLGPDGRPGVLRMEMSQLPTATGYSGFAILGNHQTKEISPPGWKAGKVTYEDLARTFIAFRFRAENRQDSENFDTHLNFRFEPDQENSFREAADFGELIATRTWRSLKRPISSAENVDVFLAMVNSDRPQRYKLVWTQTGPIGRNQPGDSLLIDDLAITVEPVRKD